MKLSQWHDRSVKPVHVGIYEIQLFATTGTVFSFFDGKEWCGFTPKSEFKIGLYPDATSFIIEGQDREWRGIVKDKK